MMDSRLPWKLKLGLSLSVTGLAISIFMAGFMDYFAENLEVEPAINFLLYLSIRIIGNMIAIIGFVLLLLGFMEYVRIHRLLLVPPQGQGINPSKSMLMQFTICHGCHRKIPFESILCPYCGLKQVEGGTVTLKSIE
jgi:F0F1-type ATP synthase membrane subunit c/vacuolar-type H+-ATPase subunit K